MNIEFKPYTGETFKTLNDCKDYDIDPYLPSPNLVEAVKLAQILKRPLLVKGEPGCGKSRLGEAVAAELHGVKFKDFYFEWNVKSTSKAQDELYTINNLQRLSDAQVKTRKKSLDIVLKQKSVGVYETQGNYIELGVLGKAFQLSHSKTLAAPPVVLIDEVDKADIDFPNDLLLELDRMEFRIPEAKNEKKKDVVIKANKKNRPLVIITSNDEKPLPAAFLRRCLFHYIDFSEIKLQEIVESKFPNLKKQKGLIAKAVGAFKAWRQKIDDKGTSNRRISTGELLNWIELIDNQIKLKPFRGKFDHNKIPVFHQALLKDVESIQAFATPEKKQAIPG